MRSRHHLRVVALALTAVLFVVLGALVAQGVSRKNTAEHLRDALGSLTSGNANYRDAAKIAAEYRLFRIETGFSATSLDAGAHSTSFDFKPGGECTVQRCVFQFSVSNGDLGRFYLVKPAQFSATIIVLQDRVVNLDMKLMTDGTAGSVRFTDCCAPAADFVRIAPIPYFVHGPIEKGYLGVAFSNRATAEQRNHALALKMSCFLSLRGCNKPCEYLPLVWKDKFEDKCQ